MISESCFRLIVSITVIFALILAVSNRLVIDEIKGEGCQANEKRIKRSINDGQRQESDRAMSYVSKSLHMFSAKAHVLKDISSDKYNRIWNNSDEEVLGGKFHRKHGYMPDGGTSLKVWRVQESYPGLAPPAFANLDNLWDNGSVEIRHSGFYLMYFQILFRTAALHQSVAMYKGTRPLMTCLVSERFELSEVESKGEAVQMPTVYLPCTSASVQYLEAGAKIYIHNSYDNRRVVLRKTFTFWGLTRL